MESGLGLKKDSRSAFRRGKQDRSGHARIPQQHGDAPVAVPPLLHPQGQDRLRQLIFVRTP
jgi:hypothetical protein